MASPGSVLGLAFGIASGSESAGHAFGLSLLPTTLCGACLQPAISKAAEPNL